MPSENNQEVFFKLPDPTTGRELTQEDQDAWDAYRYPEKAKLKTALAELDEPIDTIRPEIIDRTDLEDVPYYFVWCAECRKGTEPNSEWIVAAGDAMDAGYRKVEAEIYCKDCIPLILQRIEEEAEEDAELEAVNG